MAASAIDAKTAREAAEANNGAMTKVLAALKAAGIEDKDLQTSRLSLLPQYAGSNRPGPNTLTGYRASNRVTVRLRDVSKVASVIDTLVGAGANEIGGINFTVAAASKLLDEAREQGDRGCPPQGRDLRPRRGRDARRAAQHLRGRHAGAGCPIFAR